MSFATLRPEYLPTLQYFWNVAQCDTVILTDHFQYSRGSNVSLSAPLHRKIPSLRIPVKHDPEFTAISRKVTDASIHWRRKHMRSIFHTFHAFPFAYHYLPMLEVIYQTETSQYLAEFVTEILEFLAKQLHLKTCFLRSSKLSNKEGNDALIVNWAKYCSENVYLNEKQVFEKGWVNCSTLRSYNLICDNFAAYPQSHLFSSHRDYSILGFLLQFGPEAGYMIRQFMPAKMHK